MTAKEFKAVRIAGMAALALALAACSAPGSFPSASRAAADASAEFAGGGLILTAPKGYCLDQRLLRQAADDSFALLARCGRLHRQALFGGRNPAVITAAIGPAPRDGSAPVAADLARMAAGADIDSSRDDLMLPVIRLDMPGHGAAGASSTHWRGAFVYNGHLVSLALYAPEGSRNLGTPGALLLDELTRRTLEASAAPAYLAPSGGSAEASAAPPPLPRGAAIRPRARPGSTPPAENPVKAATSGFKSRIAGWFQ